jgi:hypothetical protein
MKQFTLYPAIVVDNNDPNTTGKVKFRIEHMMEEVIDTILPWATPFHNSSGGASTHGLSFIPEINSKIWIFYMDDVYFRNAYYIADATYSQLHPHTLYNNNVKSNVNGQSNYPDVKYIYLKNGICIAMSSNQSTPEIIIYHPSAQLTIGPSGDINISNQSNGNKITLDTTGIKIIDKNANEVDMTSTGIEVKASGKTIKVAGIPGAPNNLGCWNALPNCLFTGAPHSTDTVTGS